MVLSNDTFFFESAQPLIGGHFPIIIIPVPKKYVEAGPSSNKGRVKTFRKKIEVWTSIQTYKVHAEVLYLYINLQYTYCTALNFWGAKFLWLAILEYSRK